MESEMSGSSDTYKRSSSFWTYKRKCTVIKTCHQTLQFIHWYTVLRMPPCSTETGKTELSAKCEGCLGPKGTPWSRRGWRLQYLSTVCALAAYCQ